MKKLLSTIKSVWGNEPEGADLDVRNPALEEEYPEQEEDFDYDDDSDELYE